MKILFTHRFFWPDTAPYGLILRDIAKGFVDDAEVHVFASQPSYRTGTGSAPKHEVMDGITVRRCFAFAGEKANIVKRLLNVALYSIALMWRVLVLRPDVVTASTFPPVAAAWCASLACKLVGAKFIYHMQDIHPEVSVYSGGRMGRGALRSVFTRLDNQTLRRCAAIVVLSEDMAQTLRARGIPDLPIHVINNPKLTSFDATPTNADPAFAKPAGVTRAIFAGNLGRFQNLPVLAEGIAACFADHPNLELMFLGSGDAEAELKEKWSDHPQVRFAPFLPFAQAQSIIADADIGLVALTPDIYRVAYPSKMPTYLGLGVPLLAVIEPDSHLARDLVAQTLGSAPKTADPEMIAQALDAMLCDLDRYKQAAQRYSERDELAVALHHWRGMVDPLAP